MSQAAIIALRPASRPFHEPLLARLRAWIQRGPGQPSGYDAAPPADHYQALLERDSSIQPETLARLFW